MRTILSRVILIIAILGVLLISMPVQEAHAASIVVNTAADENLNNAYCSLREAIIAANTDAAYRGCAAGSGTDTITFGGNYTITAGTSELPTISTAMIISGNGPANTIIQAQACDPVATGNGCAFRRGLDVWNTGSLTLVGVTVQHGAEQYGGGIRNDGGVLTLSNVVLNANLAFYGAGLFNQNSSPSLTNVIFSGNYALTVGGGMYNNGGSPTITSTTFSSNYAIENAYGGGGGMYNAAGTPILRSVTFSGNHGTFGGGMFNTGSSPQLTNVTFTANVANDQGGGMFNWSGSAPALTNVTFSGNSAATSGGGIFNDSSNPVLTNVTLSGNSATGNGGGIYSISSNPVLRDTLIANSTAGGDCVGPLDAASTNNLIESSAKSCGLTNGVSGNVIGTDPALGPLASNGGATQTMALLEGSVAIDAGVNTGCPASDQRGIVRPQDGDVNGVATCDIGSYEYVVPRYIISGTVGTSQAVLSYYDNGPKTYTANHSGNYDFSVPRHWSGTVSPSKDGCTFAPTSRSYSNVTADAGGEDYAATCAGNSYTISGNVGTDGAVLSYDNNGPKTANADYVGDYSFSVPQQWSGSVTPSKAGCTFTPTNRSYSPMHSDKTGEDYVAACPPPTYTIAGNAGMAGVVLSYVNSGAQTAASDSFGDYSFVVPAGWTGSVTPSKSGCTFTPTDRVYGAVGADMLGQDYIPSCPPPTFTISGNAGADGVVLSYDNNGPLSATSGVSGSYAITVPQHWAGMVTPSKDGCTFTPTDRTYSDVTADASGEDYTATCAPTSFTVSGNAGASGVNLAYVDGGPQTATSDATGSYSFTVPSNWSGSVTPSKTNLTFTPDHRDYAGLTADQTNQDYAVAAQAPTILRVYPSDGSAACLKPEVGVKLALAALVRTPGGTFDAATVTLKLDGATVTNAASIDESGASLSTEATILYTPPINLTQGSHQGSFIYPTAGGPATRNWSFTASNSTCPTISQVEATIAESPAIGQIAAGTPITAATNIVQPQLPAIQNPYRRLILQR